MSKLAIILFHYRKWLCLKYGDLVASTLGMIQYKAQLTYVAYKSQVTGQVKSKANSEVESEVRLIFNPEKLQILFKKKQTHRS